MNGKGNRSTERYSDFSEITQQISVRKRTQFSWLSGQHPNSLDPTATPVLWSLQIEGAIKEQRNLLLFSRLVLIYFARGKIPGQTLLNFENVQTWIRIQTLHLKPILTNPFQACISQVRLPYSATRLRPQCLQLKRLPLFFFFLLIFLSVFCCPYCKINGRNALQLVYVNYWQQTTVIIHFDAMKCSLQ